MSTRAHLDSPPRVLGKTFAKPFKDKAAGTIEPPAKVRTVRTPRLLAVPEVAAVMGVSSKTVRRLIGRAELHVHHVGRLLRVSEEDLNAFLASQRR